MMRLPGVRSRLALHRVARGEAIAPALLLLHALGASANEWAREWRRDWAGRGAAGWPGPVFALDFAGHGRSEWLRGGAYTPERCAADADSALAEIGGAFLLGRGLGAYTALLLAGARSEQAPAALLLPGSGLDGGGEAPGLQHTRGLGDGEAEALLDSAKSTRRRAGCDPLTQSCARDLRPGPYARDFADRAGAILLAEDGGPRPPWWQAVRNAARVQRCAIAPHAALAQLRAVAAD